MRAFERMKARQGKASQTDGGSGELEKTSGHEPGSPATVSSEAETRSPAELAADAVALISEPADDWEPNPIGLHLLKIGGYAGLGERFGWEVAGQLHDLASAWPPASVERRKELQEQYRTAFHDAKAAEAAREKEPQ
jgi:hypothetical protein